MVAAAGAGEGGFERGKEQQGEVGLEVVADGCVHGEDARAAETAAGALVGFGGVGVAVAEDDGAGGERGGDDLGDGLGAVGEHEGHLGERSDGAERGLGARVEQDGADAVAERGGAGLAQGDDGVAGGGEPGGETAQLGGFAGAVQPFERDEVAARHRASLPHNPKTASYRESP